MKRHGMRWPLLNAIHRLSYLAMVDYHGTLKKKTRRMNCLFWLAIHDLCRHNEALDIPPHLANTILVRLYFLLLVMLVNFLNTNRMIV
jgi:hypothetical protein